jgi:hypothetical protein
LCNSSLQNICNGFLSLICVCVRVFLLLFALFTKEFLGLVF